MSRAVIIVLAVLLASGNLWAAAIGTGDRCNLQNPLRTWHKPGKRGRKAELPRGATVEIVDASGKKWWKVRVDGRELYAPAGKLARACVKNAEPARAPTDAASAPPKSEAPVSEAASSAATTDVAAVVPNASDSDETAGEDASSPPTADAFREARADALKIAVMQIRGSDNIDSHMLQSLNDLVPEVFDQLGPFRAISYGDIQQMLQMEELKQTVGCDDVSCLAEIGGAIGAAYMVSGSVLLTGETYLIQLQLMDITRATVSNRVSREYEGGPKGLFDEMRTASKILVRDLLAARSGTLVVTTSEEGATIRIDGTIVGVSPLGARTVAGGVHTLGVEKEGFITETRDFDIRAEQQTEVDVTLRPSQEFLRTYRRSATRMRLLSWTGIGVGAAALAGGAATYVVARGKAATLTRRAEAYNAKEQRTESELATLRRLDQDVGTLDGATLWLVGGGTVALAAGLLFRALGDDPSRYEATTHAGMAAAAPLDALRVALTHRGVVVQGKF